MKISIAAGLFEDVCRTIFPVKRRRWAFPKMMAGDAIYSEAAAVAEFQRLVKSQCGDSNSELLEESEPKCRV